MRRVVLSRWFGLADLALVLLSGAIMYAWPQLSWRPLLIALLPWIIRVISGRFPFKRTVFDIPLAVFIITAGVGVWAAYQPETAWAKFWIILGAILLYYALVNQPEENFWSLAGILGLCGVFLTVYFLFSYDWQAQPNDLEFLNNPTAVWMSLRPDFHLRALNPNMVGGILAMLLPFPVALGLKARANQKWIVVLSSTGICGIIAGGLLLTSSRGAWLASIAAFGIWALWGMSGLVSEKLGQPRARLFAVILIIACIPLVVVMLAYPGGLLGLAGRLPGMQSGGSRIDLARSAIRLATDFPFTGGGLGSFGGLYSQYIMITPFFLFAYSHNFFLDVALEQGIFGLLAISGIFLGSAGLVITRLRAGDEKDDLNLFCWAVLASLVGVGLHGLIDDALYGERGTPLLFLLAGSSVALWQLGMAPSKRQERAPEFIARKRAAAGASFLGLTILVFIASRQPLLAEWYANLGAVEMARFELAGWPADKWNGNTDISQYGQAMDWFERSLAFDRENLTAIYRSGLIAMQAQDFSAATRYLQQAQAVDPEHRGIHKALGYSYAWSGQPALAAGLLEKIPEAEYEMNNYVWWWRRQGRLDLAGQARELAQLLHGSRN